MKVGDIIKVISVTNRLNEMKKLLNKKEVIVKIKNDVNFVQFFSKQHTPSRILEFHWIFPTSDIVKDTCL